MTCPCPACGQPIEDLSSLIADAFGTTVVRLGRTARLSVSQASILGALRERHPEPARNAALVEAIYGYDGGPLDVQRTVRVQIVRLRQRLAPLGVAVWSVRGIGYRLTIEPGPIAGRSA